MHIHLCKMTNSIGVVLLCNIELILFVHLSQLHLCKMTNQGNELAQNKLKLYYTKSFIQNLT